MARKDDHLMVAAIDFGTTYSGYAFSMRHEFKTDPLKIHANQAWNSGGSALLSLKTPTCLLLNDNKELVAFGFEAENKYADIVMDEEQDDFYYFHRFKMNLHNHKNITAEMTLEDVSGKPLPAIDVFSLSIKALADHLMTQLRIQGTGLKIGEIQWVLTVPAIWTDKAKQFMRKSAEKAGIPSDRLLLALEPEAASIYCQYLSTEISQDVEQGFTIAEVGSRYMVVDLGGGTADITVHEKMENGKLKEICRATGNDCGGTSIDGRFFQLLVKLVGGPLMKTLQTYELAAYLDIFREFEIVKRTIDGTKSGKINITIPYVALDRLCQKVFKEDLMAVVKSSTYANEISLRNDKMRINVELVKSLFKPTIDSIILLMGDVLKDKATRGLNQLLLVGGFAECKLLREAVNNAFADKRIIIPGDSGLSVLKGAVLFGHKPDYIQSRILGFTYGERFWEKFNREKHDENRAKILNGQKICTNVFKVIVERDKEITAGTIVRQKGITLYENQKAMNLEIYISTDKNPSYTDEESCTLLGTATITFPDSGQNIRSVDAEFIFGNTELTLNAVDLTTGHRITANFDLI